MKEHAHIRAFLRLVLFELGVPFLHSFLTAGQLA